MRNKGEKGIAMLAVMAVIVILAGFSTALLTGSAWRSAETDNLGASCEAMNAAQSAAEIAFVKLMAHNLGDTWSDQKIGCGDWDVGSDDLNGNGYPDETLGVLEPGVDPVRLGNAGVYAWSRLETDPNEGSATYTIFAGGVVDLPGRAPMMSVITVQVDVDPPEVDTSQLQNGATGTSGVAPSTAGPNAQTDSYDSSAGAYNPGTAGSNGGMASNYGLVLDGTINGDVYVGGSGGVTVTGSVTGDATVVNAGDVSDPSKIGGTINAGAVPQQAPPVEDRTADFLASNDNAAIGGITSISSAMTLPPGKYYFTDISITGGQLTIQAPSEIFVAGTFKVTGTGAIAVAGADPDNPVELFLASGGKVAGQGLVNTGATPKPGDLMIYSHGTDEIKFAGNANVYAGVYAPNAPIKVTGSPTGSFYGSLVGSTVTLVGYAFVHYDESMPQLNASNLVSTVQPGDAYEIDVDSAIWSRLR